MYSITSIFFPAGKKYKDRKKKTYLVIEQEVKYEEKRALQDKEEYICTSVHLSHEMSMMLKALIENCCWGVLEIWRVENLQLFNLPLLGG